jgi:hypothetical protein
MDVRGHSYERPLIFLSFKFPYIETIIHPSLFYFLILTLDSISKSYILITT